MENTGINVLSLCDGMSCGQIALKELGIKINRYYASEIDKNAIKVTMDNFPETVQMGDIRGIKEHDINELPKIDLIMAGFPCRDLSIITRNGGSKNWKEMHTKGEGLEGEHSGLYHEFMRIYKQIHSINPNVKFLVENVASMKEEEKQTIDKDLGVCGEIINSAFFSAQNRERIYWTNIEREEIENKNKDVIEDILEKNVPEEYFDNRPFIPCESATLAGRLDLGFKAHDIAMRVYRVDVKAPTLTACRGGNLQKKVYVNGRCRKLTPTEYRRLQVIPDWYKMDVAKSHIYNMCGDGWTIPVIMYILRGMGEEKGNMKKAAEMPEKKAVEIEWEYKKCFTTYINRPGAADLLQWMCAQGFFEAPASTKYHGAEPGGLAQHSINVFQRLAFIAAETIKPPLETLAVCGLLHDLCKIDAYKDAPEGSSGRYDITRNFPAGHGEKSVILIMRFMQLTDEEILAIRWHMGQYDFSAKGGSCDLDNAFNQCKLAVMLHLADMMATHFDEADVASCEKK